jgi:hypothetical protein
MENKRGSQLSSNGIEADATHQESNSLDVNENNREGFRFSSFKVTVPMDSASEMIEKAERIATQLNVPILFL